jgi:hypothetical protein
VRIFRPLESARHRSSPTRPTTEELLERVHWHIARGDALRAGAATRAGAVLSTNTLVIAGVALAFSLRNHRPSVVVIAVAIATLVCVVLSVGNSVLALITLRTWDSQFGRKQGPQGVFLYCHAEIGKGSDSFENFKSRVTTASAEELLEWALAELWRCGRLHEYRYQKLRIATRWLLVALIMFLAAVGLALY